MSKKTNLLITVKKIVSKIEKIGDKTDDDTKNIASNNKFNNFLLKWKQVKYIPKFLSPVEKITIKISILVIIISLSLMAYLFIKDNITTKPTYGGTYAEIIVGAPQYINPIYASANEADRDLTKLLFAGLLKFDENHKLINDLAKEWFLSEDKKTYTFILRDDVYWPDGKQFTSEDVTFTIEAIQNEIYASPLYNNWFGVRTKTIDDHKIQFILPEPYTNFTENLTLGILPAHLWSNILPENAKLAELNVKPIGLGAYKFDNFIKDKQGHIKSYNLISNKNYHLGRPYIDKITFKFFPTFELAVANLKNHNADGLDFLPLNLKKDLEQRNDLNYYSLSLPQYTALFFNTEKNILLKNKDIRKALSLLINKETIVKQVLESEAIVIDSPILPGMPSYKTMEKNNKINDRIEAAKKILTDAGWTYQTKKDNENKNSADTKDENKTETKQDKEETDKPKYLSKEGQEFKITLTLANQPQAVAVAEMIQKMWLAAGIKTDLNIIETNQIQKDIIAPRNFEILLFGEILDADGDLYPFWHSSQANENGLNLTNFKNDKADKILTTIRKEKDTNKKNELLQNFKKIIKDESPAIFLYSPNYTYVIADKIKGVTIKHIVTPDDRLNGINSWYIKTKKGFK